MLLPEFKQRKQRISRREGETLLDLAQASIRHGLQKGKLLAVRSAGVPDVLVQPRSTFVTLRLGSALRGCIGSIKPQQPLAQDVNKNAFNAAFHDPRFPPLRSDEYPDLNIHISVLSDFESIDFLNQTELLSQIRKNRDGLLLEFGPHRSLLLPSVWKDLPDKQQFLQHLKMKAGLQAEFWSDQLKIQRFTTQSFSRAAESRRS